MDDYAERIGLGPLPQPWRYTVKFSELVRLLEDNGFRIVKEKGSNRLIRVDYYGAKEVPTGTCHSILKAAGIKRP